MSYILFCIEIMISVFAMVILIPDKDNYKRRSIICTFKELYDIVFHETNIFGKITGGIFFILCIPGILGAVIFEVLRITWVLLSDLRHK